MLNLVKLGFDGIFPALVIYAEHIDADAGGKVDIFFPLAVEIGRVVPLCERHGEMRIGRH